MKKPDNIIVVRDVVSDTLTNAAGYSLYQAMVDCLTKFDLTELSFKGSGGLSTSFLNSSFGALVDEKGLDTLKKFRPTHLTKVQMDLIKRYLADLRQHQA